MNKIKEKYTFIDCTNPAAKLMDSDDIEKEVKTLYHILTNKVHFKVYGGIVKKIMEREGLKR